jgi:DNA-binding transcriptional LysR family regulator
MLERSRAMSVPELRQMRYFVAVAEERHFGHAAERLRIAQPGLSQQIKALERIIGMPLLTRDRRGAELTPAGAVYLEHARLVLELAQRAVDGARLAGQGTRGLLKVGTSACGIHPEAGELLDGFRERYPEVLVEIHPAVVPQNLERLARRSLDAAIVFAPFEPLEGVRYRALGTTEVMIAIPESHPLARLERLARSDLLSEPFLAWPRSTNPPLVDHIHGLLFGDAPHPRLLEIADVTEARRLLLVAEGQGIAASIDPSISDLLVPGVVFRAVESPAPLVEFGLAWPDRAASPFAPLLVELATGVPG